MVFYIFFLHLNVYVIINRIINYKEEKYMAKPRVFISSTYYDLKHIRNSLESFIDTFGYESILFESGDIAFHHDEPLDISCYDEIKNAHMLVLIIGGRYGSATSDTPEDQEKKLKVYNSITKKEYESARSKDIPIYIFIEKNVLAEYYTYKKNRDNATIEYAHVDNTNIFVLIDDIYAQARNNLVKEFENFDDISTWLRDQWAGIFADCLSRKSEKTKLSDLSDQINDLRGVNSILREYSELIMRKIQPDDFENIITSKNKELTEKRFKRFIKNPLIEHLLINAPKGVGEKTLFNAFMESNDIEELVQLLKYDDDFIEVLLGEYGNAARDDYQVLKNEF